MKTSAPYGTWKSPIAADLVAANSIRYSEPRIHGQYRYWIEGRPQEQGRSVIVRQTSDGQCEDLLPEPWSARSKVHEYGGSCYAVLDASLVFVNTADQQLYRLDLDSRKIEALTEADNTRYADLSLSPDEQAVFAICEEHRDSGEVLNRLILLNLINKQITTIDESHDFVSNPTVSPDGRWLSYLSWDHPHMPWDETQLWLCQISDSGDISAPLHIAGNGDESLFQPQWSPDGSLFWVSDKTNWWNLYRVASDRLNAMFEDPNGEPFVEAVCPMQAEFGLPQWVFGMSTYGFLNEETLFSCYCQNGDWKLGLIQRTHSNPAWQFSTLESELCSFQNIDCAAGSALFVGASTHSSSSIYEYSNGFFKRLTSHNILVHGDNLAEGKAICIPTPDGKETHAFLYHPLNQFYQGPENAKPPLIVMCHGGPTGATDTSLNFKIQFWTSRGFAVMDVNYRGSTGYGRAYRHALRGQWGVMDVNDLVAAADYASEQNWAQADQKIIRGSSAGGFTVLAALTDSEAFQAGCSLYGICDLEALVRDTHKFEARYLDQLIGPHPEQKQLYIERSPIHKVHNIRCAVAVFQGLEDKVVPPAQAEMIVNALSQQGLPVAYVTYENEAHGFRQAQTIRAQLEAELYFYQSIFQLGEPSSESAITIQNWDNP